MIVLALKNIQNINQDKVIRVIVTKLDAYCFELRVSWRTRSGHYSVARSKDEAVVAIKAALEAVGIDMPFSHHVLYSEEK